MNQQLLKAFRRSKWTPYKLAKESGLAYSTVTRWLKGETDLASANAERIALVLGYRFDLKKRQDC